MVEFVYPDLDELSAAYLEHGFSIVRHVLDVDLVAEANEHIAWLIKRHPDLRPESLGYWLVPDDPFWIRLVSDNRLLDIAEALVGPHIGLFAADYIAKPPGDGREIAWHQDGSYWPLDPMEVVTLWVAYSESDSENGCVRIIPGTQHMSLQERDPDEDETTILLTGMDQSLAAESKAVEVELAPGDVSIHHPNIIHGSRANKSERWRRGGTYQYIPATTRVLEPDWPCFLFRGEAVPGINRYRELPKFREEDHFPFRGSDTWK